MPTLVTAVRQRDISAVSSLLAMAENSAISSSSSSSSAVHHTPGAGSGGSSLTKTISVKQLKAAHDLNRADAEGNTALHIAVALANRELVRTLLQCSKIAVNVADAESGYTPLHKALYAGELALALMILQMRPDCDLTAKDREGNTPLDLLMATIEMSSKTASRPTTAEDNDDDSDGEAGPMPATAEELKPATSLWTWGANTNYILGHQNSDNRAFPEQVEVTANLTKQAPLVGADTFGTHEPLINRVVLSKYHCGTLANDDLFMNGFGADGRLGLGNVDTVLRPTVVEGIKGKVESLALGPDHSIAVTTAGEVYTWGSNAKGQLGYATHSTAPENHCEVIPREVGGVIKRVRIAEAAASNHHSVVFSDTGAIYTWGAQAGQLGYQLRTDQEVQAHPKKITDFPQQLVQQVAATKTATAVLTASHEVFVFAEYKYSRVSFALQQYTNSFSLYRPRSEAPPAVAYIVSGNHQFAALTTAGDVFMWSPPEPAQFADTWQQKNFTQKRPKRGWSARKKHLVARDVAIGIDSSLIIRTESGHVYVGTRRNQVKVKSSTAGRSADDHVVYFKFEKVAHLQHVRQIAASQSGAFGALRWDRRPESIVLPPTTLDHDIRRLLQRVRSQDEGDNADAVFVCMNNVCLRAHRAVLACRSPALRRLFSDAGAAELKMRLGDCTDAGLHEVLCPSWHAESLALLCDYIYTPSFRKTWDYSLLIPNKGSSKRRSDPDAKQRATTDGDSGSSLSQKELHAEFNLLVDACELRGVVDHPIGDPRQYRADVLSIHSHADGFAALADVALLASDGTVLAHSTILSARCAFFAASLGGDWVLPRDDHGRRVVALPHVRAEVLQIVLRFLHGCEGDEAFRNVTKNGVAAFLEFVVDVLACADELMMEGLKKACEIIILRGLKVANAVNFLEVADWYGCDELKDRCLEFVCWNIEALIQDRMFESLSEELVAEVEGRVRALQLRKQPHVRGPDSQFARVREIAQRQAEESKRLRRLDYERAAAREAADGGGGRGTASVSSGVPSPVLRPESSNDGTGSASDDVFELEMDSPLAAAPPVTLQKRADASSRRKLPAADSPSPSKPKRGGKRAWTKLSLNPNAEMPSPAAVERPMTPQAHSVKSWAPASDACKVSLKDIMSEAERPGPTAGAANGKTLNDLSGRRKSVVVGEPAHQARPISGANGKAPARPSPSVPAGRLTASQWGASPSPVKIRPVAGSPLLLPHTPSSLPFGPPSPLSLPVTSPIKMSQKERRRSAAAAKLAGLSTPTVVITPGAVAPSPWSPAQPPPSPPTTAAASSAFSGANKPTSLRVIMNSEARQEGSAKAAAAASFAAIQAEQHMKSEARTRVLKKPLAQIQVEERAIAQLREFYAMTREAGSGEFIDIEREPMIR
ncbi:hypothetical protein HDU87_003717 [Geranomyces variabilis]|uniref:BTB domain-containing protein n=1 Tax=Geranomyces variabilis TaxID=109894 RepID=A0AAD5XMV3_9FUNG|nr:hypothetical protein HDU87_003717 [Geranomyces variabilis]